MIHHPRALRLTITEGESQPTMGRLDEAERWYAKLHAECELDPERIRGMIRGVAIGDARGLPFEQMTHAEIRALGGCPPGYLPPTTHTAFSDAGKGATSDDWQLTHATIRAIVGSGTIDLRAIAREHIAEYDETTAGWGGTTKRAILLLKDGVDPDLSGAPALRELGKGNGVLMKLSPVVATILSKPWSLDEAESAIAEFTCMSHATPVAVSASMAYAFALMYCLKTPPDRFSQREFIEVVEGAAERGDHVLHRATGEETFSPYLYRLKELVNEPSLERLGIRCGTGGDKPSFVGNSLPMSLACFLKHPHSVDSMTAAIEAGGDTDSNASLVGSLLGALNGPSVFPKQLADELQCRELLNRRVDELCTALSIGI